MFSTSSLKLVNCDITTSIFVKVSKSRHQVLFTLYFVKRHSCSDKFFIIDCHIIVFISLP